MDRSQAAVYEIHIRNHLESYREDWFDGMTITHLPHGITALSGLVVDQPALHGLLSRIRDLGAVLILVQRLEPLPSGEQEA